MKESNYFMGYYLMQLLIKITNYIVMPGINKIRMGIDENFNFSEIS